MALDVIERSTTMCFKTLLRIGLFGLVVLPCNAIPAEEYEADLSWARHWPMEFKAEGREITIYEPQIETFKDDRIAARAAVSVKTEAYNEPVFGVVWLESLAATDRVVRTVEMTDIRLTQIRLPEVKEAAQKELSEVIREGLKGTTLLLSLDDLLAQMETVKRDQQAEGKLRNEPPRIVFRDHPGVKIQYDGPPRLVEAGEGGLMRVANTPFLVVMDPSTGATYLKGAGQWFMAEDPLGPFQGTDAVPGSVKRLAENGGFVDPDQGTLTEAQMAGVEIVTATEPTELIWTDGPPQMGTLTGTDLLYVANTASDMFVDIKTQNTYVLLSGRWFRARNRSGPWSLVLPDNLPEDFKRIPPGSEKGDVLAHVGGTQAAKDAVLDSYIPQTAAIDRQNVERPQVQYDGDPKFQQIEGSPVLYAINTPFSVLNLDDRYYCCYKAVWYVGPAPNGPWEVCTSVPREIYAIPPSCPVYPVRYVTIYDVTPDWVYCGYTPGYVGCYRCWDTVVFGTGYYYPGWWGRGIYYPRPCTYGFGAHYNSFTGNWGFSLGLGGPRAWLGLHFGLGGWDPDRWHDGWVVGGFGGWWGYGGFRDMDRDNHFRALDRDPRSYDRDRWEGASHNLYDYRRDLRRDMTPRTTRARNALAENPDAFRATQFTRPAPTGREGNVFADKDGHVYRKSLDGWEPRDGGQWMDRRSESRPPTAGRSAEGQGADRVGSTGSGSIGQPRDDLDQHLKARSYGESRPFNYQRPAPSFSHGQKGSSGGERSAAPGSPTGQEGSRGGDRKR